MTCVRMDRATLRSDSHRAHRSRLFDLGEPVSEIPFRLAYIWR